MLTIKVIQNHPTKKRIRVNDPQFKNSMLTIKVIQNHPNKKRIRVNDPQFKKIKC